MLTNFSILLTILISVKINISDAEILSVDSSRHIS